MKRDRLRVVGSEILFGNRTVGQLAEELWPTLRDAVATAIDSINLADATVPLREFEDRVEGLLAEIDRLHGELALRNAAPPTCPDEMDFLK